MNIRHYIKITTDSIISSAAVPAYEGTGGALLLSAFKALGTGYAKFYKMDSLSKLGFLASEIILADETERFVPRSDRAVVMMNSSASLCDDRNYQATIADNENFYPSPAVFVYTLPNIVTGEIAIRNKYLAETSFYIMPEPEARQIYELINDSFRDRELSSVLCGWVECSDDETFEAILFLVEREAGGIMEWNIDNINSIINKNLC